MNTVRGGTNASDGTSETQFNSSPDSPHEQRLAVVRAVLIGLALFQFLSETVMLSGPVWIGVIDICVIAFNLVMVVSVFRMQARMQTLKRVEVVSLLVFSITFLLFIYGRFHGSTQYATDELAFDQYAASVILHGHNPYVASMLPSLNLFHVPQINWSFTVGGQLIDHLSYPALSILLFAPFAGLSPLAAMYVDAVFWVLSVWLLYFALPPLFKSLSLFFGASSLFLGSITFGVTDSLLMPFLIVLAWKWHWFFEEQRGLKRYLPPVMLGLAMAVKQTAWFLLPVLVLAVYKETKSMRQTLQFTSAAVIAFIVPNLFFIAASPQAWFNDIAAPFFSGLLPSGLGIIRLPLMHVGGGYLSLYSLCAVLLLLGLLVDEWLNYERVRWMLFLVPSLVLFLPTRSFWEYLIDLFPVFFVSVLANRTGPTGWLATAATPAPARKNWSLLVTYTPFLLALLAAIVTPSPILIKKVQLHYSGALHGVDKISVTIQNGARQTVTPHVTLLNLGKFEAPWRITNPTAEVQSGSLKTYVVVPSKASDVNLLRNGFSVDLFTSHPASVSSSPTYSPSSWRSAISRTGDEIHVTISTGSGPGVSVSNFPVVVQKINNQMQVVSTQLKRTDANGSISLSEPVNSAFSYQAYLGGGNGADGFGYSDIIH